MRFADRQMTMMRHHCYRMSNSKLEVKMEMPQGHNRFQS